MNLNSDLRRERGGWGRGKASVPVTLNSDLKMGENGWGRGNVYDKQVIMRVEKVVLSKQIILA